MAKPAEAVPTKQFNPIELQNNLSKAFGLWQQFSNRMMSAHLNGKSLSSSGNDAFTQAANAWAANLVKNPEPLFAANVNYLTQQTQSWQHFASRLMGLEGVSAQDVKDRRFKDPAWNENVVSEFVMQSYLNASGYWKSLLKVTDGMDEKEAQKANFFINCLLDAVAPNNYAATNPQVWNAVWESNGENLVKGMENLLNDFQDGELRIRMTDTKAFQVGKDMATTPGKVVFRNQLIELIQYTPSTEKVRQRPLLVVPPWINKFYILDLREKNSFVKWSVDQGHTVFVMSWANPDETFKDLSFEDYLKEGTLAALDAIEKATGEREVNMAAYCLGGTLAAATLAYLSANGDNRIQSATFFTTMIDFAEPGEIGVFLDEGQVSSLEKLMQDNGGYLDGKNMASAFNMLRANDLIWSFFVNLYLLGKDPMPFDLLYWNSDSTRMPAAMHSFYLRNMYLNNCFSKPNGVTLLGTPIDLSKVTTPVYFVSAHDDHIAPWRSTYTGAQLFAGPKRFVLGESGHIAGIVNPAPANKYGHWVNEDLSTDAQTWLKNANKVATSWWLDWDKWVSAYAGEQVAPRQEGSGQLPVLGDAPGTYVLGKS